MTKRLPGAYPTRSRAVVHGGLAWFFAVAPGHSSSLYEQAKGALAVADRTLAEVGSSKPQILTVTVFIADMVRKEELNRAWDEWADRENPPMRACVSAGLTGDCLVEMVFTAAVG